MIDGRQRNILYSFERYVYILLESHFIEGLPLSYPLPLIHTDILTSYFTSSVCYDQNQHGKRQTRHAHWWRCHGGGKFLCGEIWLTTSLAWSDRYVGVIFNTIFFVHRNLEFFLALSCFSLFYTCAIGFWMAKFPQPVARGDFSVLCSDYHEAKCTYALPGSQLHSQDK